MVCRKQLKFRGTVNEKTLARVIDKLVQASGSAADAVSDEEAEKAQEERISDILSCCNHDKVALMDRYLRLLWRPEKQAEKEEEPEEADEVLDLAGLGASP